MKCKKRVLVFLATVMLSLSVLPALAVRANGQEYYSDVILQYYDLMNGTNDRAVLDLYGNALREQVQPFFSNEENMTMHEGIYNVIHASVLCITEIDGDVLETIEGESYSDIHTYFVKTYMQVYSSDKYYSQGVNYFTFCLGKDALENICILNIEIPSYTLIETLDADTESVEQYKTQRNSFLYGNTEDSQIALLSDGPVYRDYVGNPSTIRVLVNGTVKTVDFKTYCKRAAAVEMNSGLNNTDGYRACAMALKMFAIHKIYSAASGANYDITTSQQGYSETKQISTSANNAVEYIHDYFLLDYYGAVFPTFYRTQASNKPQYCVQNGGILPQKEADALAASTSWQDVLRYYYTRKSNVQYYNTLMTSGNLFITTSHYHDWRTGTECAVCGAHAQ